MMKNLIKALDRPLFISQARYDAHMSKRHKKLRSPWVRLPLAAVFGSLVGLGSLAVVGPTAATMLYEREVTAELGRVNPAFAILKDHFPDQFASINSVVQGGLHRNAPLSMIQSEVQRVFQATQEQLYPLISGAEDSAVVDLLQASNAVLIGLYNGGDHDLCAAIATRSNAPMPNSVTVRLETAIQEHSTAIFRAILSGRDNQTGQVATPFDWIAYDRVQSAPSGWNTYPEMLLTGKQIGSDEQACRSAITFIDMISFDQSPRAAVIRKDVAMAIAGPHRVSYVRRLGSDL